MVKQNRLIKFICLLLLLMGSGFLAVYARGASYLAFVEVELDDAVGGSANGINGSSSVQVSSDGNHVYVTGSIDDGIGVFSRDTGDLGKLTFLEAHFDGENGVDGLNKATDVALSPDDQTLYVTGRDDDALAVFNRDDSTGLLTFVEFQRDGVNGVTGLDGAYAVAVSPDGKHVYVTAELDHAVVIFSRDQGTGALTYVATAQDGVNGVTGLGRTRDVIVSPDGAFVYVANGLNTIGDGAIVVFSRNATSGALSFVEAVMDDATSGNQPALSGATTMAISPDERHLYVASRIDDAVSIFRRDTVTGQLVFIHAVEATIGGIAHIPSLDGAVALDVTPDGRVVIVGTDITDTLHLFVRNETTGHLFLFETHVDNVAGVDGLEFMTAVQASADGDNVYVTGQGDNGVAVFARESAPPQTYTSYLPIVDGP